MPRQLHAVARMFVLVAALGPLGANLARADTQTIRAVDNGVWLGAGAQRFHYRELAANGSHILVEKDWIPSVSAGLNLLGGGPNKFLPRNLYLGFEATGQWGNVPDQRETGQPLPAPIKTGQVSWTIRGRMGYALPLGKAFMLIPYAEASYRHWDRDFPAAHYSFQHTTLMGGLLAQYSPSPKLVLSLDGGIGTTRDAQMAARRDGVHFPLGHHAAMRAEARADLVVTPHFGLFWRSSFESFGYGQSPPEYNPASGHFAIQSTSRTRLFTTELGFAYHF